MGGTNTKRAPEEQTFWHFRDANGNDVIVNSKADVPEDALWSARQVVLGEPYEPPPALPPREPVPKPAPAPQPAPVAKPGGLFASTGTPFGATPTTGDQPWRLEISSALVGLLCALIVLLMVRIARGLSPEGTARLIVGTLLGGAFVLAFVTLVTHQLESAAAAQNVLIRAPTLLPTRPQTPPLDLVIPDMAPATQEP